jgi:pilus assembly protein Flp/PilA
LVSDAPLQAEIDPKKSGGVMPSLEPRPPSALPAWQRFFRDGAASTSIEYAVIAAGIAMAIITTVGHLGTGVSGLYNGVATALK